ncbi:MAG: hypothetical protein KAU28_11350 [Phycisphaerae bacterium]|nr:hypothetical protein [Phycisphaerae bacterium]
MIGLSAQCPCSGGGGIGPFLAMTIVIGVLIEVPVMLMLVKICLRTRAWFSSS